MLGWVLFKDALLSVTCFARFIVTLSKAGPPGKVAYGTDVPENHFSDLQSTVRSNHEHQRLHVCTRTYWSSIMPAAMR